MRRKKSDPLESKYCHIGPFWGDHVFPPAPFNPSYDPKANERSKAVSDSMESDNFYATHTREECKAEWGRRYDELKVTSNK